tara:strand:- start:240 stop:896 length:657 start_codon:yes stop_codon:yes gene_type:complete
MKTINSTILFLSYSSNTDYLNYLGNLNNKIYIVEYIASYYHLILKKMNSLGLLQFFEQDGHSFKPYYVNHTYPLSLNEDTEAFDLFIKSLLYSYKINFFKKNKDLIIIYNFFNNLNFKIEKQEETVFCDYCKISVINEIDVCNSCQRHIEQNNDFYYLSRKMKNSILENERYFYKNIDLFNQIISDFVYYNLKDSDHNLNKLTHYYNKINYIKKISNF